MKSMQMWHVWFAAMGIYIVAVFHRSSLGVAGLLAAERFGITSSQLATFLVIQLAVYAILQAPAGILLDRVGSRRMLLVALVIVTASQLCFAFVESFGAGVLFRVLLGAGDAMVFVSVLKLVTVWLPSNRAAVMTQVTGVFGQLGSILAATPLSIALREFGWTTTFAAASVSGGVLGAVLLLVVRDQPQGFSNTRPQNWAAMVQGFQDAWRTAGTRMGFWSHFGGQFGSNVFILLWGYPFLVLGQGMSPTSAASLIMVMTAVKMAVSPFIGILVGRFPKERWMVVVAVILASMGCWAAVLARSSASPTWLLVMLAVVVSIGGPAAAVGFDFARTYNPSARIGSAVGIVNVGGFAATLIGIALIGFTLDAVRSFNPGSNDFAAFRWAMSTQFLVWVVGLVFLLRSHRRLRALGLTDICGDHALHS